MTVTGITTKNRKIVLPAPYAMVMNMEENVPADDVTLTVPCTQAMEELTHIEISDGETRLFQGIVDEQSTVCSPAGNRKGTVVTITARSMAALLLDNETEPVSYCFPSEKIIYEKHVKPFGIEKSNAKDDVYYNKMNVQKGSTHWQALYGFCKNCFNAFPRITPGGRLEMERTTPETGIVFSNSGGQPYISITENNKRCERISRVFVKTDPAKGYETVITDEDAVNKKIVRQRYLNATLANTPLQCADNMIQQGRNNSYAVTLVCPGRVVSVLGFPAAAEDPVLGRLDGLYVSRIRYVLRAAGETTTIVLRKKEA